MEASNWYGDCMACNEPVPSYAITLNHLCKHKKCHKLDENYCSADCFKLHHDTPMFTREEQYRIHYQDSMDWCKQDLEYIAEEIELYTGLAKRSTQRYTETDNETELQVAEFAIEMANTAKKRRVKVHEQIGQLTKQYRERRARAKAQET